MPAAAAAAAATAFAGTTVATMSAAVAISLSTAAVYAAAYAATVIVGSTATSMLVGALTKKPKESAGSEAGVSSQDRSVSLRQAIAPRRVIYGEVKTGGVYTFLHTTGNSNEYLNCVITLSGHEIEAIDAMYFDGEEIPLRVVGYPDWTAQSYSAGTTVYSNGKYYQRNATAYSTVPDYSQHPADAPTLWTVTCRSYAATQWSAGSYATGARVFDYEVFYQRTATAYPTAQVVDGRPEDNASLWDEVTVTGLVFDGANKYSGYVHVEYNLGTDNQQAFAGLMAEAPDKWTGNHRQQGCAGAYVRLKYDPDVFPNGVPAITFLIRGKNDVYDPRTLTSGYSNNAALCAANYLSDARYGLRAAYGTEILDDDLIEAANICDEDVTLKAGGTEKRYTVNGVFDCDETPYSVLTGLTGAMAGSVITQGIYWYFRAGAWRIPEAIDISDADVVGGITINSLVSRSDIFNTVHGTFISPENSWQETDFPEVTVAAYVSADSGETIVKDIQLPWTVTQTAAQRIARIMLEEQRRQITVSMPVKTLAYQLQPWDNITLTFSRYGWTAKTFQVRETSLNIGQDGAISINLSLRELDANAYAWDAESDEGETVPVATTTLPSFFDVAAPGLVVTDEVISLPSGTPATNLVVTILPPNDVFVDQFEVEYKPSTSSTYILLATGSGTVFHSPAVEDGLTYDVRARSINASGVRSAWVNAPPYTVVGQLAPPPDVTGFNLNVVGDTAYLSWNAIAVADLSGCRIRFSPLTTGASLANAFILIDKVGKPATSITVPAMVGTYIITALDFGGRESINPTLVVCETAGFDTLNAVTTTTQDPTWPGVLDDVRIDDGDLVLGYASDAFAVADKFEWPDVFLLDLGYFPEGTYYFDAPVDLSEVYTSRLTAAITVGARNDNSDVFLLPDVFAVADKFFVINEEWGCKLFVSTTNDDPGGSPVTWSAWSEFVVGDYTARAFKFKLVLSSLAYGVTPVVSALSVNIDMPDRIISDKDVTVPVTGLSVVFSPAFKALKSLTLNGQGLATGDYYAISGKTESGFTIIFRNSAGAAVQRTMDYKALGYGRVE